MVNYSSKPKQHTLHKSVDKNIYLQILIQNPKQSLDSKYIDVYNALQDKTQSHFPKNNHPCVSVCED